MIPIDERGKYFLGLMRISFKMLYRISYFHYATNKHLDVAKTPSTTVFSPFILIFKLRKWYILRGVRQRSKRWYRQMWLSTLGSNFYSFGNHYDGMPIKQFKTNGIKSERWTFHQKERQPCSINDSGSTWALTFASYAIAARKSFIILFLLGRGRGI